MVENLTQWGVVQDQHLLNSVDEYINEYGNLCEEDWIIIARGTFHGREHYQSLRSRYDYITNQLMVYTLNDYNAYCAFSDANDWVSKRQSWGSTSLSCEIERQRLAIKEIYRHRAAKLESDILFVILELNPLTLFTRELWEYFRGAELMTYMSYLDTVDKLLTRLPDSVMNKTVHYTVDEYTFFVNSDMRTLEGKYGIGSFVTPYAMGEPLVALYPEEPIIYMDRAEDSFVRTRGQDADAAPELFANFRVLKVEEWQILLSRCPFNVWEFLSPQYNDNECFTQKLSLLGVTAQCTNTELLLELCSHVLPKYWAGSDEIISDVPADNYRFDDMTEWSAVTIYHTITYVSLRHVRKTVLFLINVGLLVCCKLTPREWVAKFVHALVRLPCGESWNADPLEFERVRERLKYEIGYDGVKFDDGNGCIKGESCWFKRYKVCDPADAEHVE